MKGTNSNYVIQKPGAFTLCISIKEAGFWCRNQDADLATLSGSLKGSCVRLQSSWRKKLWLLACACPDQWFVNANTWTRERLCHLPEPHSSGGFTLTWVWNIGIFDMAMSMSTIYIPSVLHPRHTQVDLLFLSFYTWEENINYLPFHVWFISLDIMFSISITLATTDRILFFIMAK